MSATLSPYTKKHALKPLVYALILASWAAQTQAQSVGSSPPSSRQDESRKDTDRATRLDTITVVRETRDEAGKTDVFEKDVSNVYAGKEEIELYKGSSVGDLFKGLNGVYAGDSRNSGALDPNIRGIQGEGRIPLTIDGTEQATSVWLGPAGVANRNYVDPNMISSILVEKGVSATSGASGIGGSVQIRTLQVANIDSRRMRIHIERGKGMFSFLGVSAEQVQRLKSEYGVYMDLQQAINLDPDPALAIVFRSLGGLTRLDNLATLCTKCHDLVVDPDLQVRDKRGLPLHPWRTCAVPT